MDYTTDGDEAGVDEAPELQWTSPGAGAPCRRRCRRRRAAAGASTAEASQLLACVPACLFVEVFDDTENYKHTLLFKSVCTLPFCAAGQDEASGQSGLAKRKPRGFLPPAPIVAKRPRVEPEVRPNVLGGHPAYLSYAACLVCCATTHHHRCLPRRQNGMLDPQRLCKRSGSKCFVGLMHGKERSGPVGCMITRHWADRTARDSTPERRFAGDEAAERTRTQSDHAGGADVLACLPACLPACHSAFMHPALVPSRRCWRRPAAARPWWAR